MWCIVIVVEFYILYRYWATKIKMACSMRSKETVETGMIHYHTHTEISYEG